jgi:hypothetical protein
MGCSCTTRDVRHSPQPSLGTIYVAVPLWDRLGPGSVAAENRKRTTVIVHRRAKRRTMLGSPRSWPEAEIWYGNPAEVGAPVDLVEGVAEPYRAQLKAIATGEQALFIGLTATLPAARPRPPPSPTPGIPPSSSPEIPRDRRRPDSWSHIGRRGGVRARRPYGLSPVPSHDRPQPRRRERAHCWPEGRATCLRTRLTPRMSAGFPLVIRVLGRFPARQSADASTLSTRLSMYMVMPFYRPSLSALAPFCGAPQIDGLHETKRAAPPEVGQVSVLCYSRVLCQRALSQFDQTVRTLTLFIRRRRCLASSRPAWPRNSGCVASGIATSPPATGSIGRSEYSCGDSGMVPSL